MPSPAATPVALPHAYRLLDHGQTTLISTAHGERRNILVTPWVMPIAFSPPKFAAVIAEDSFTRELLSASGECVLMAPTPDQLDLTCALGAVSGRAMDKFAEHGLETTQGVRVAAPLLDGCAAWIECRVVDEPGVAKRHNLFVLEALAAWAGDPTTARTRPAGC